MLGGDELQSAVFFVCEGEVCHGGAVGSDKGVFDEAAADSHELALGRGAEAGEFGNGVGVHGSALEGDEAEVEERAEQYRGGDDELAFAGEQAGGFFFRLGLCRVVGHI